ncbi:hypothetical protein BKA63DRAFT_548333 [Paraphoma chrysanthemicola]|nr:hypothetical protein BKA63DRAFT_548333 [Paraphoma chrysanthemicola]
MAPRDSQQPYTYEELEKAVDIEIVNNEDDSKLATEHMTFSILLILLLLHVPGLAKIFANRNIQAIKLRDVLIKMFGVFIGWIRMEDFRHEETCNDPWTAAGGHCVDDTNVSSCWVGLVRWAKATLFEGLRRISLLWQTSRLPYMFLFAQTFDIPRLRQDATDRIIWCHNTISGFDSSSAISKAYANTKPGSGLRQMLVVGWREFEHDENMADREFIEALPQNFPLNLWLHSREMVIATSDISKLATTTNIPAQKSSRPVIFECTGSVPHQKIERL